MLRLGRRTLALCLVIGALIGGVVSYSRASAEPNPLHAFGLDVCDGKPCFKEIIPGVTSWEDAQAIIARLGTVNGTCVSRNCTGVTVNGIEFVLTTNDKWHVSSVEATAFSAL